MRTHRMFDGLESSLSGYLPSLLGAVAILLGGWIVALLLAAGTRRGLAALKLNQRLSSQADTHADVERIAGRIVFWAAMLFAVLGMFSVLRVDGISGPLGSLATAVLVYVPNLLLALGIGLLAWLLATLVRNLLNKVLSSTRLDDTLSESAGMQPVSNIMGNVAYWLILLLALPAVVGVLGIEGLMGPLNAMTSDLLGMLPNLFAAAAIALIGWVLAKVVRGLVGNLLAASGIDSLSRSDEATEGLKLSQLGGTLAFILIIVPALIAALDALQIHAISDPLTHMLDTLLQAVPHVLSAAAILTLAWFLGRFAAALVTRLLSSLGFDRLPERLGLGHAFGSAGPASSSSATLPPVVDPVSPEFAAAAPAEPVRARSLSELGGRLALFFIMLFATVEAAAMLGFDGVHDLLSTFIAFGGDILLGLVIFTVGYWLANLAADAIRRANPDGGLGLSRIARVAILGLVLAMGLRAMGIADDIVNLAFALVLGAVAVALALAFGLGGRDAAGRIADHWARQYMDRRRDE